MSKLIIIDDDPIHQKIVQIILKKQDAFDEIDSYTEAEIAVEMLQENARNNQILPDVILLDLNMPVMDGWDFLECFEKIKNKLLKSIKIFVVTSSVDEKDKSRARQYDSVVDYITKPLSDESVRKIVNY